jgi:1,4-alpha-glucan branching enzyme
MNKAKKDLGAIVHNNHVTFRVWAPFANNVALTGSFNEWSKTPMQRESDGCWSADVKHAKAGQEYAFLIDTGHSEVQKNDPRALHVTTSAGRSVIVDTSFDWSGDNYTPLPQNQQVIYELHIGTFNRTDPAESGTFETATAKLDHLADLGITTIELMPIASMSLDRSWWGYVSDYMYAVESQYGGRRAFLEFVKAAHARDIGVILDVVYNHLGPDTELDLWQFDGWSQDGKGGIYFYNDWRSNTPWGDTRLDYGRPEVRQYILDNVLMWLQTCHVDGLRFDSTSFMRNVHGNNNDPTNDIPEAWSLLQEACTLARKINPNALLIAEDTSGNDYITKSVAEGGAGFNAQWETNLPFVLRPALEVTDDASRNLHQVTDALARYYNGDAFQRVIYSESHDSAANGAARLAEEISPGNAGSLYARRRLLLASAIIMTAPGVPMLFQGQEFMEGGSFNDWQTLDWTKAETFAGITLAHKHLIALRKNQYGHTGGLIGQSFAVLHLNEETKVLAYHRWDQGGPGDDVVAVCNFANRVQHGYSIAFPRSGQWRVRFCGDWKGYSQDFKDITPSEVMVEENGAGVIDLAPYSVLILSQD